MNNHGMKIWLAITSLAAVVGVSSAVVFYRQARGNPGLESDRESTVIENAAVQVVSVPAGEAPVNEPAVVATDVMVDRDAEIRQLEERLKAKDEQIAMLHNQLTLAARPVSTATNAPGERRSWMDDIRENDPERYKEIMERRETARQAAKYEIAKKAAHFLQKDDSAMSDTEAKEYARMMDLLTESFKLTEQLNAELPREQRWEIARNLRENMRDLSPMLEGERDKEFYQIGKDLGYSDEDATAFAGYIREVIDLTSVQSIFRNSMQAMGGGWGGRGGGSWGGNTDQPSPRPTQ